MKKKSKIGLFIGLIVAAIGGLIGKKPKKKPPTPEPTPLPMPDPMPDPLPNPPIINDDPVIKKIMTMISEAMQPGTYAMKIEDIGVNPSNTPEQNSDAWEAFHNSLPVGAAPSIYPKSGDYHFARKIIIDSRPIHLIGDNGSPYALGTRFFGPGLQIDRTQGYQGAIIQWIYFIYEGDPNVQTHGISAHARCTLFECGTKGFTFNGVDFWANIEGEGTDASGSLVFHCFSLENTKDGFFAGRMDANAITFIGCDARDNGRYGFNDDSFLGNYFFGCMAHNNAGGNYFVRDKGNARSTFVACYSEDGSPPNNLGGQTTVVGGIGLK